MIGNRIRERRVLKGMKQTELARAAGISASYLNLIEHNRRRIGGKTLNHLANALDVPTALLAEGADAALLAALNDAAGREDGFLEHPPEQDRAGEFADRFPGWAELVADLARQRDALESTVKALTDRIAHDPELSTSLHEVISTVTAIRSTASILVDEKELEPQWKSRFHRNLNEDSLRLAEEAQALVRYLEGAPGAEAMIGSPQNQVQAFFEENSFHFHELEGPGGSARIEALILRSDMLQSEAARRLARALLHQYVADARTLPEEEMARIIKPNAINPQAVSDATGAPLARIFRRLALLPEAMTGPVGLFICDGTGKLLLRKPALGFDMARGGTSCAHWPLYQVLAQPGTALIERLRQHEARVLAMATCEATRPARLGQPALQTAHMLILPDPGGNDALKPVGANCLLCALGECEVAADTVPQGGAFDSHR